MSGLFCSPKLYCSTGKLCSFGKLIIISLFLFNIIFPDNAGAVQDDAWYMDFIKTHLDIEPPADWKKEPLERFHNAIGYANRTMGICMMAFPLDDYRQYQLQTDTDWSINFGRTMVHRPYDRNSEELIAPLKIPLQEHVSFYIIVRQCGRLPKPLRTRSVCSRLCPCSARLKILIFHP